MERCGDCEELRDWLRDALGGAVPEGDEQCLRKWLESSLARERERLEARHRELRCRFDALTGSEGDREAPCRLNVVLEEPRHMATAPQKGGFTGCFSALLISVPTIVFFLFCLSAVTGITGVVVYAAKAPGAPGTPDPYFGSLTKAWVTMYELSLANWVPVCRFMVETQGVGWMAVFLLYVHLLRASQLLFLGLVVGTTLAQGVGVDCGESMRLIFLGLRAALQPLAVTIWCGVVVTVLLCMILYASLAVHAVDPQLPLATTAKLATYFGSFPRTLLTVYEVGLGNWAPVCHMLMELLDQAWAAVFIAYANAVVSLEVVAVGLVANSVYAVCKPSDPLAAQEQQMPTALQRQMSPRASAGAARHCARHEVE